MKRKRSKIDENEQLPRLKVGTLQLVLLPLPETILLMLLTVLVLHGEIVRGCGIVNAAHFLR